MPTHLELPVEVRSRFATSLLTQTVLWRCHSLSHLCGVFRQLLARCTAVLRLHLMLLFVTPRSAGARCPFWAWNACSMYCCTQDLKSRSGSFAVKLTLCVCHAMRLRLSQLSSGRVELDLFCCTSFNAGIAFHVND